MVFWIDILTAKQARFFKYFTERYNCLVTTREYSESLIPLQVLNVKHEVIGKHGRNLLEKLVYSIERSSLLLRWYLEKRPNALIHHGSVEASRLSFQANIPIFDFNDSPEAKYTARLTAPLSTLMIVPKDCGEEFRKIGAQRIIEYDGLTPVTWLKRHKINENVFKELNIDLEKITILIREPAYLASHLESSQTFFNAIVKEMMKFSNDVNLIILERYKGKFIDVPSLLNKTDIVIATGSIIGEALVSGVPLIIDYLPIVQKMYERFVKENLIIHVKSIKEIVSLVLSYIKNPYKRHEPLYNKMEDPLEIFDKILKEEYPNLL